MEFGQNMSFFEQRVEVLLEAIRNGILENAEQTARVANALEKLDSCVDSRVKALPRFNINDVNFRP
jgi:hypothetical protein